MARRIFQIASGVLAGALAVAQFFPPARTNPPADPAASFESARPPAQVAAVIQRACIDCHSNRTVWPAYSLIAPVSWLIAQDVREGRAHLNFSEWGRLGPEMALTRTREICQQTREGDMPPWYYQSMHRAAKLREADIRATCSPWMLGDTGRGQAAAQVEDAPR
ncbi:MAG TPA: heme-binding domain-containing protein, partial [Candidatus Sulfopaludibacter sp.]|nr:heme-binding domain-containing protein [Candidatus Sulfopaludibacter sp.]